jgi:signal peptidase II
MLVLFLIYAVAILDQATKFLVCRKLAGRAVVALGDYLNLRLVQNTGAAWGILEGLNNWLVLLSFAMLAALVIFRRSLLVDTLTHRIATGLMAGGIAGNLVDRIRLGYVVDFLDFHWRSSRHFPSFNVADSAICIGVGLYILSQFTHQARQDGPGGESPGGPAAPRAGRARGTDAGHA